ncbi:MAG TPA: carboxypeptidase-like regulatory domain-containing protein [Candidatus Kapabacteria bacterium]|nr:carboxypeptidase-like regulatory domain-containing protein [Candidatus Kapabacteria bacterium]
MKALRIFALLVFASLGFFLNACRHPSDPNNNNDSTSCCHGIVTIAVQDSAGNPLHGASVGVTGEATRNETTDSLGHATVRELCPGTYHFRIARDGYNVQEFSDTLTCNDTMTITRTLTASTTAGGDSCCNGRDYFTVKDSTTQALLSGATVVLTNHTTGTTQTSTTSGGDLRFGNLCPGTYICTISKDGYHSATFDFTQGCDGVLSFTKSLLPTTTNTDSCCNGRDYFTVTDSATHAALSGATITLTNRTNNTTQTGTTSGSNLRLGDLCPGSYLCTISKDGYQSVTFDFDQGCDGVLSFTKSLLSTTNTGCDSASLAVHVEDSTHSSNLSGVTVTVRIDGHSDNFATGTTNGDGYYTLYHMPAPNTYIITFSKDGFTTQTQVLQFGDCRQYTGLYHLSAH